MVRRPVSVSARFGLHSGPAVALAQLVEHRIVAPKVTGSSPVGHPTHSVTRHTRFAQPKRRCHDHRSPAAARIRSQPLRRPHLPRDGHPRRPHPWPAPLPASATEDSGSGLWPSSSTALSWASSPRPSARSLVGRPSPSRNGVYTVNYTSTALSGLIGLVYWVGFWGWRGQSPGMIPFNMRIVMADDGSKVDVVRSLLRYVGLIISFVDPVPGRDLGRVRPAQAGVARQDRRNRGGATGLTTVHACPRPDGPGQSGDDRTSDDPGEPPSL